MQSIRESAAKTNQVLVCHLLQSICRPIAGCADEVRTPIAHLSGTYRLMAQLLSGSGLHLMECVCLRVKDLDFAQRQVTVRDSKGMHDRVTLM